MEGRILTVKKSTWLIVSLVFNFLLFLGMSIVSFIYTKNINSAFFFFCIATGIHQIIKSILFKFDSSCYFGVLLLLIGGLYILSFYYQILNFYTVFIVLSFSFASFCAYSFFNQPFQLVLALSLFFVSIGLLLFLINLISVWIFVAIILLSVILLVVRYFTLNRSN